MKTAIFRTIKLIFFNLLFLELLSFILIRFFYVAVPPMVYKQQFLPYFIDTNLPFTTWHYNNTTTRQIGPKWNVEFSFNSYGARDKERELKSEKKRFVFLGDSFIEGFGLAKKDRITDTFEKETGIESLNFAASGLGQTQMRILYDSLASKFDHDAVVITFYPYNDLKDIDYENRLTLFSDRYRPYSVKNESGVFYTKYYLPTPEESAYHSSKFTIGTFRSLVSQIIRSNKTIGAKVYTLFKDLSYSGALVNSAIERIKANNAPPIDFPKEIHALENLDPTIWEVLNYELSHLKNSVDGKPLILLFIPNPYDFDYRKALGKPSLVQDKIKATCDSLGIVYVDLLETMPSEDAKSFYLKNDDHFNKLGDKMATEILIKKLKESNIIQ